MAPRTLRCPSRCAPGGAAGAGGSPPRPARRGRGARAARSPSAGRARSTAWIDDGPLVVEGPRDILRRRRPAWAAERVRSPWMASVAAATSVDRRGDRGGTGRPRRPVPTFEDLGHRDREEQHEGHRDDRDEPRPHVQPAQHGFLPAAPATLRARSMPDGSAEARSTLSTRAVAPRRGAGLAGSGDGRPPDARLHRRLAVAVPRLRSRPANAWRPPVSPDSRSLTPGRPGPAGTTCAEAGASWRGPPTPASAAGTPFRIIGAHTDSPNLRVKPHPDAGRAGYRQLAVEVYGGALLNSWLDRDLGLSGRVVVRDGSGSAERLLLVDRPLFRVPQLAIHLDREITTNGLLLNAQQHLSPVWGVGDVSPGAFAAFVAAAARRGAVGHPRVGPHAPRHHPQHAGRR